MNTKRKKRIVVIAIIAIVAACGVAAFMAFRRGVDRASANNTEMRNNTISLERMDLTRSVSATGTVQSSRTRTVSAAVNGIVVKQVKVNVGDTVKKGDALVTFDKSDLKEALSDAQENLDDAESEADRNISSAREQLSDARENYSDESKKQAEKVSEAKQDKREAEKQVSKVKKQISSAKYAEEKQQAQEQLQKAEEALKQAESAYENAVSGQESTKKQNKEQISNAENALESAESNKKKSVREAQKQVDEAEKNLEKCAVTAPIDGVVTAVGVQEGDTYSGGTMFQIDDTSSYTVTTTVDEYDISSVSVGQRVVILTETTGEDEIEGEIVSVAPSTGSTSVSSGSQGSVAQGSTQMAGTSDSSSGYEVKIAVNSKDERLRMGLTAKCSIILEEAANVYAVPYDAVHKKEDGSSVVYVAEKGGDNEAFREVTVTPGMESDYYIEISGDGLSEGMKVEIPTDETSVSSKNESDEKQFGMPGMGEPGGGSMPQRGDRTNGRPSQMGGQGMQAGR